MTATFNLLAQSSDRDTVAYREDDARTAAELLADSAAIAALVSEDAREHGILVLCEDRYRFAASILAAWQRGYAVALPPNMQRSTIRELMQQTGIRALLHDGLADRGIDVRGTLDRRREGSASDVRARLRIPSDRWIATVYTSGSTGVPRACRKTAGQLLGEAESLARVFGIGTADRVLATVPAQHIYGLLTGVLVPLTSGAALVTGSPLYPDATAARVRQSGATVLASVPAQLRGLASLSADSFGGLRQYLSSGAPLDEETARALAIDGRVVSEILGASETGGFAYRRPAQESSWHPMPSVKVAADGDGRLLLTSPFLDPALPQPFHGGDCIELAPDGTFRHLGRVDGVVKVGGKRVLLAEMEARLRQIAGVDDAAVLSVTVESARQNEIWAAVATRSATRERIRDSLLEWFDPVALPRRLRIIDALPREANGKLPREKLLDLFVGRKDFQLVARDAVDQGWDIRVKVPPDLYYLRGHFDGLPILAGVVILNELVVAECRRAWPGLGGVRRLRRLKFRKPIRPNDVITLSLRRMAESGTIQFESHVNGQFCNSGVLVFEERV